jgi:hypothetical protein
VVAAVALLLVRYYLLSVLGRKNKFIYRDLYIISYEGCYSGPMIFVISILTVIIGPASFKIVSMNTSTYVILNAIAAAFFILLYPSFSPVSGFSTIDVFEKDGNRYCRVGKVMSRNFRVVNISEEKEMEIVATRWRARCYFRVAATQPALR